MKYNIAEFIGTIQEGGAETLVKDYALLLDKNRFNAIVIVIGRNVNAANDKLLRENGAKIVSIYKGDLKNQFILIKVIRKLNSWWYIPYRLKKILHDEKIDVLHIHLMLLHLVKKVSGSIKNIKLFYTCHSEPKRYFTGSRTYENKAAKYLIEHNNLQMIALHEDMRKEINSMFGINNTVIIRNGIDFTRFKNIAETKEQVRQSVGIPENAFVVGHVGRFFDVKNHNFLVDIFAELCKRKSNAFLLLVGDGELKWQIENKLNSFGLKEKYLILSRRSDIPQLMKAMDILVFPSLYEGLSVTLVEAQVSGLRCIISDNINKENILSENTVPFDINKSPAEWCDVISDKSIVGQPNGNIEYFDMNKEIKRLESLYLGKQID